MVQQPATTLPIHRRIYGKCQSCGNGIQKIAQRLGHATGTFFKRRWRGEFDEKKKVVLRKSLSGALLRCSVHFLPVFVTIVVAYFNLAGRFIGAELQGWTGDIYQAVDILCLQVVAKLQVRFGLLRGSQLADVFAGAGTSDCRFFRDNSS